MIIWTIGFLAMCGFLVYIDDKYPGEVKWWYYILIVFLWPYALGIMVAMKFDDDKEDINSPDL